MGYTRLADPLMEPGEDRPWAMVFTTDMAGLSEAGVGWVVDGMVPEGSVTLIAAPPGSFKTWLALCIARAVAKGEPFAGRKTAGRPVVYVDRENPRPLACERVRRVGTDKGFIYWPYWSPAGTPDAGSPGYEQTLRLKPLIVFDSLVRFHGGEENSSTEMARVMGWLKGLAAKGATVLVLHHKGKNESEYRGSSEILAGVQVAWSVRKSSRERDVIELKSIKNHYAPEEAFSLRFADGMDGGGCFPDGSAHFEVASPPEDLLPARGPWERIKEALMDGEKSLAELSEIIGYSQTFTRKVLKEALEAGNVYELRSGQSGKLLFSLTPF
jgi:hypothetical protein